ncbi:MAG: hypothetical protein KGY99_03630 [Phycisphaerae bacterium]|nr:hypothetical protein [Phycisphaerae bacterium]
MSRRASTCLLGLVLTLTGVAHADKLVLVDGRQFEGTVTEESDTVTIKMDYGRMTFPKDQVEKVILAETPQQTLERKLAKVAARNAAGLYDVGVWARQEGLEDEAAALFTEVVALDPDHAGAREALGQVRIDGTWQTFDKAVELCRSKLATGDAERVLETFIPKLVPIAARREATQDVARLRAEAQLGAGRFDAAAASFAALAEAAEGDVALRCETIAGILRENPDGMYVVRAPFPPRARLLGSEAPTLAPGPASLKRPLVLKAALHAAARDVVDAGGELMDAARQLETKQPAKAHVKYKQAAHTFAQANALVPGIARSHRIEAVRRRIALVRNEVDADAAKLDAHIRTLAQRDLSPEQWREKLLAMIRRVDRICPPLEQVLALAEPYPRELFLEIQWAEADLKKMQAARDLLVEELNGQG